MQISQAMILCAGLGTRMRHLTEDKPKAMVHLDGRPLLDHVIEKVTAIGVSSIIVNIHAHASIIETYLRERDFGVEIHISDERDQLLDTGGAITNAISLVTDIERPLLVANVDSTWTEDKNGSNLNDLLAGWDDERMDARLLLADPSKCLGYTGAGDFDQGAFELAIRRHASERFDYVYAGYQLIKPSLFANKEAKPFSVWDIWQPALDISRVSSHVLDGFWLHVGTPLAVKSADKYLSEHALSKQKEGV